MDPNRERWVDQFDLVGSLRAIDRNVLLEHPLTCGVHLHTLLNLAGVSYVPRLGLGA